LRPMHTRPLSLHDALPIYIATCFACCRPSYIGGTSLHSRLAYDIFPPAPLVPASSLALYLDNRRASRNCLYARTCRPFLRARFCAGINAYMRRTCPFGISLRYIASIIRPPYIIGWLFVVNTFSAIAGYFLLSRAITSNANFSDIVCGVLILCSELISTNLSICAFLLLK